MSPQPATPITRWQGFPRVSGDEPTAGGTAGDGTVFSPRERG